MLLVSDQFSTKTEKSEKYDDVLGLYHINIYILMYINYILTHPHVHASRHRRRSHHQITMDMVNPLPSLGAVMMHGSTVHVSLKSTG